MTTRTLLTIGLVTLSIGFCAAAGAACDDGESR